MRRSSLASADGFRPLRARGMHLRHGASASPAASLLDSPNHATLSTLPLMQFLTMAPSSRFMVLASVTAYCLVVAAASAASATEDEFDLTGVSPPAAAADAAGSAAAAEASATPAQTATVAMSAPVPLSLTSARDALLAADWTLPLLTLLLSAAIFVSGVVAARAARAHAEILARALLPTLAAEFASGAGALTEEAATCYSAWCSGNTDAAGLSLRLTLRARSDALAWVRAHAPPSVRAFADYVSGPADEVDELAFVVALPPVGGVSCLASVMPAPAASASGSATPVVPAPGWPEGLRPRRIEPAPAGAQGVVVHADCREVAELVLSRDLVDALAILAAKGGELRALFVTDLAPLAPAAAALPTATLSRRALRLVVALPADAGSAVAALAALVPALLRLVGRLGGRLSPPAADAVRAVRDDWQRQLSDAEAAVKREAARKAAEAEREAARRERALAEERRIDAITDPEKRARERAILSAGSKYAEMARKMRLMKGFRNVGAAGQQGGKQA